MVHPQKVISIILMGCVLAACGLSGRIAGLPTHVPGSKNGGQPVPTSTSIPGDLATAREKIKHVVIIMQENRSFDSYFGTYPGADGFPVQNGK